MSCRMRPLLFSVLLLLTVATFNTQAAVSDVSRIYHEIPSLEKFDVCYGGGCAEIQQLELDVDEWQRIVSIFNAEENTSINALLENAVLEREQISNAIGVFEGIVGLKTGTSTDLAGTFDNASMSGQLDCNDEAINGTTYMHLMRRYGLIKLHEIEDLRTRNFFFTGWPHTTAVIHEIATGDRYAVDSWLFDNGTPATIVPFALWKSGYIPLDSPLNHATQGTAQVSHSAE